MKRFYLTLFILSFIMPLLSMKPAMTADQVINNMIDSYKKQMRSINNITIRTSDGVTYQKMDHQSDPAVYMMRSEQTVNGMKTISVYDGEYYWTKNMSTGNVSKEEAESSPLQFYESLKEMNAEYGGTKQVDGHKCHVLNLNDADVEKFGHSTGTTAMPGQQEDEMKADVSLFVDAEKWVVRKMVMDINNYKMQDKEREGTVVVENTDFRDEQGMLVPWETVSTVTIEMSEEEKARAEEMKKQMENIPPDQREEAEKYMGSGMEMSADMMDGEMKIVRKVTQVRVNTDLDESLFNGEEL